jgi:hypothetical protein
MPNFKEKKSLLLCNPMGSFASYSGLAKPKKIFLLGWVFGFPVGFFGF